MPSIRHVRGWSTGITVYAKSLLDSVRIIEGRFENVNASPIFFGGQWMSQACHCPCIGPSAEKMRARCPPAKRKKPPPKLTSPYPSTPQSGLLRARSAGRTWLLIPPLYWRVAKNLILRATPRFTTEAPVFCGGTFPLYRKPTGSQRGPGHVRVFPKLMPGRPSTEGPASGASPDKRTRWE